MPEEINWEPWDSQKETGDEVDEHCRRCKRAIRPGEGRYRTMHGAVCVECGSKRNDGKT